MSWRTILLVAAAAAWTAGCGGDDGAGDDADAHGVGPGEVTGDTSGLDGQGSDTAGVGGTVFACATTENGVVTGCIENHYTAPLPAQAASALKNACELSEGTAWSEGACPTVGRLGVCTVTAASGDVTLNVCYDKGIVTPAEQQGFCQQGCASGSWTEE